MGPERRRTISVIGGEHPEAWATEVAFEVGGEIARAGFTLVTGGLGGVMEAASRGCREAGGEVVAIVPGLERSEANGFAEIVVATGVGQARNLAVVASGDAVIAIDGEWGTLSEIGFARKLGRPVILLRSWRIDHESLETGLQRANTAVEAVRLAQSSL